MGHRLLNKKEVASTFEAIAELAEIGGLWTPECAVIVGRLAHALGIAPNLPVMPPNGWTVTAHRLLEAERRMIRDGAYVEAE